MQPRQAEAIRARLRRLADDPAAPGLDVRPLVGRNGFRLRVGGWRVIYTVNGDAIEVAAIAPRGDVYDR